MRHVLNVGGGSKKIPIPDRYAGDASWWFVPGRLAFRWIVQAAGFDVQAEFGEREGPRDLFPVVNVYLRAIARP